MNNESKIKNEFVGDPIVDAGLMAIKLLANKETNEYSKDELKKIADDLLKLYLTPAWSKEMQSIFPNSTYIQPAKNYNKEEKSREFLYELIDGIGISENREKYCIFCGNPAYMRKDEKPFNKTQIPLVGSSDFTNFFPSFNDGIEICARCALAIQFSPVLYYKTGGKPSCISCNNKEVMQVYGKECIEYITRNKLLGAYKTKDFSGIFDEGFKSPQNALFHLAYKVCLKYKRLRILKEHEEIVIYHIDNFNKDPKGVRIYKLPNEIFKFVIILMNSPEYKKTWFNLLDKHYSKFDTNNDSPIWKTNNNRIHEYLLKNESILWAFKDDNSKKPTVPWIIVECYMELVRNMNKQRIEGIKNLADKIAICIEENNTKKRINDIISARDFPTFRNQLRLVFRDWQKLGKEQPMITYEEYISTIIPEDYSNWKEVQDLIIIRLYEKLHNMLSSGVIDDVEQEKSKGDEE
ncbi:CRISPR-associated protein (Cas_CXXC_CXXC) [uncultured archaeon]|nr:CRISPR-associated protein (Cas_CXXC_CXXC) [uncultured archaeon]